MWDLSSLTRDQTRVPATKAQSPNHWTAREFPAHSHICVTSLDLAQLQMLLSCCLITISTWMLKGISNVTRPELNSSYLRLPGGTTNSENGYSILPASWLKLTASSLTTLFVPLPHAIHQQIWSASKYIQKLNFFFFFNRIQHSFHNLSPAHDCLLTGPWLLSLSIHSPFAQQWA